MAELECRRGRVCVVYNSQFTGNDRLTAQPMAQSRQWADPTQIAGCDYHVRSYNPVLCALNSTEEARLDRPGSRLLLAWSSCIQPPLAKFELWRCTTLEEGFRGRGSLAQTRQQHATADTTDHRLPQSAGAEERCGGPEQAAEIHPQRNLWRRRTKGQESRTAGEPTEHSSPPPFLDMRFGDGAFSPSPVRNGPVAASVCDLFQRPLGNLLSGTRDIQLDMPPLFSSGRYTQDSLVPDRGPRSG